MLLRKLRIGALSLIAATTALIAPASQADVWYGSWDPQFGTPFTAADPLGYNLGWGGKVQVNDDACTPVLGNTITNADACSGGAFIVTGSLKVTLYNYNTNVVNNTLTLTFTSPGLTIDSLRYDSNGTLTGISTTTTSLSDWVADTATVTPPNGAGTNAEFAINFVLDGQPCLGCGTEGIFTDLPTGYDGPVLFARQVAGESCGELGCITLYSFYRSDIEQFPAKLNFTPEPGSLALLAAGLLAAGGALRRRRTRRCN